MECYWILSDEFFAARWGQRDQGYAKRPPRSPWNPITPSWFKGMRPLENPLGVVGGGKGGSAGGVI